MKPNEPAPPQAVWNCAWSRPGYRLIGVDDEFQPESLWVCVRGERRDVTEKECETCEHWTPLPAPREH